MRDPDEELLHRNLQKLGDGVQGADPWEEISRRRRGLEWRRRRRTVATASVVIVSTLAAGALLGRAFLGTPDTRPGASATPSRPTTLREQLRLTPGIVLARGDLGGDPWILYLFDDPDGLLDGAGPDIYLSLSGVRYHLDRPDAGSPIDILTTASEDGREVLVVGVGISDVDSVELTHEGEREEARFVQPEGGAFARVFWVFGADATAVFRGDLVTKDSQGRVLDERIVTGTSQ